MDFDELRAILAGLEGQMVEACVYLPGEQRAFPVATFGGLIESFGQTTVDPEWWRLSWRKEGDPKPTTPALFLTPSQFERAEVEHSGRSLGEVIAEDDDAGTTWFLWIHQLGTVIELTIYI